MKKLLLSAVAAVFAMGVSNAQEIDFGAKVGVNFAKLQGDAVEDLDGRTGINVGVTGEYMFNETFALQVEALYSQQGLQSDEGGVEQKLKLDYINVPVLAKFYIGESGFSVEAGPQIGFLVSDKYEVDGVNVDEDLNAETIDLSAGGGIAYKFKEGTSLEGLSANVRYMIGLNNVYKDNGDTFGDDITNSVLAISLGYKF
ncbi:porin family protein [Nonlabens sp. Asnod2-A12]|uniref:porin family protein n=1 Tax=Nonlabens sp. Asnod2-A12 TaxID=3160578 RepID=UPI00386FD447